MSRARAYFSPPLPHVLAHRGLHLVEAENSIEAFAAALTAGASHLETDVRVTQDNQVVLHHDAGFEVDGTKYLLDRTTLSEANLLLQANGQHIDTLEDALIAFPHALFNIDVKTRRAALPAARIIKKAHAQDRVLIAGFNKSVRELALSQIPHCATSASRGSVFFAWVASVISSATMFNHAVRKVDALQIPITLFGIRILNKRLVDYAHDANLLVHIWTLNDAETIEKAMSYGVDGVVTDRTDVAKNLLFPV